RFNNNDLKSQISILKQLVKGSLGWLSRMVPKFISQEGLDISPLFLESWGYNDDLKRWVPNGCANLG
ncbi:hypothetical protein SAMN02745664_1291, partial [Moraxella cuniculi DSM 21768]